MTRFLFPAFLWLLLLSGCRSQTVTPADKAAFLTASDLQNFGYFNPKLPPAKWSKTAYGDGTFEIEFEIETPDSDPNTLYLNETLGQERSTKDALEYLTMARGAMNLTLKAQSLSEKSLPNQTIYGDGSSLTTLQTEGITVGNIFSARKGGRTFVLMIVGVAFEDPKEWDAFAGQKIRAWLDGVK